MVGCQLCAGPSLRVMDDEGVRGRRLAHAIAEAIEHVARERNEEPAETMRWLAPLVGVSDRTVKRWTTGDTVPDALKLVPLAHHLGVNAMLFVDPPEVPEYPLSSYLVEREAAEGVAEGLRRARRSQAGPSDRLPVLGQDALDPRVSDRLSHGVPLRYPPENECGAHDGPTVDATPMRGAGRMARGSRATGPSERGAVR